MLVITPQDIAGTGRDRMVGDGSAHAMCYLAEEDGCGFSFSTLEIAGGSKGFPLHYRNHIEVNLVLEGKGEIHNLETDERWPASPGTLYVVGPADRHEVALKGDVKVVSLFNPPIKGNEHHQDFGGYPPSGEIPAAWVSGRRQPDQPAHVRQAACRHPCGNARRRPGRGAALPDQG